MFMGPVNSAQDPLEKHETLFSKKKKKKGWNVYIGRGRKNQTETTTMGPVDLAIYQCTGHFLELLSQLVKVIDE